MKTESEKAIKALLARARQNIIDAAAEANGGKPAPQDVAELMGAWGQIVKVVKHPNAAVNKTALNAELDMLSGLMGCAE